jgi:hypothetical protein
VVRHGVEQGPALTLLWEQPAWLEEARIWIENQLTERGLDRAGPVEQVHVRPWSTVLRVPVSDGCVFFKSTTPLLANDPGVTHVLARLRPECVLPPLAVDAERQWMLMPDGGSRLRDVGGELADWEEILRLYAGLQIDAAPHADELLRAGALDRRLGTLPAQLELSGDERFRTVAEDVAVLCSELASYAIPETIQHDDFHDGNVLVRDGRYLFFDWGDSCVGHPFSTLTVTLRSVAHRQGLEPEDAAIERLRDVYLEEWTAYGSRDELLRASRLAYRLGMIVRALVWHPVGSEENVTGWLEEFRAAPAA